MAGNLYLFGRQHPIILKTFLETHGALNVRTPKDTSLRKELLLQVQGPLKPQPKLTGTLLRKGQSPRATVPGTVGLSIGELRGVTLAITAHVATHGQTRTISTLPITGTGLGSGGSTCPLTRPGSMIITPGRTSCLKSRYGPSICSIPSCTTKSKKGCLSG